jgi:hypothetical protein
MMAMMVMGGLIVKSTLMRSRLEQQLHAHARVSHQAYQWVGIAGEFDIFRSLRKKACFRVELEEFVDMAFALLQ